jgi:hypothetical protein
VVQRLGIGWCLLSWIFGLAEEKGAEGGWMDCVWAWASPPFVTRLFGRLNSVLN